MKSKKCNLSIFTLLTLSLILIISPCYAFTITYTANSDDTSGSVPDPDYTDDNNEASIATQGGLVNSNYYFNNWSADKNATAGEYTPGKKITMTEDLTLYAIWKLKPYSITYDSNNATGKVAGNIPVETKFYGANDINIPICSNNASVPLANPGLTFSGWHIDPDALSAQFSNSTMPYILNNTTLYAVWTCNIIYDGNGNDGGTVPVDNKNYTYNSTAILKGASNLTRANYHIGGWQYDNDSTAYNLSQRINIDHNLYLTAKWLINPYSIAYTKNGAEYGEAPIDGKFYNTKNNATILNSNYPLMRSGYVFMGWNNESSSTEAQYIAGDLDKGNITFGYNNITLYPVWIRIGSSYGGGTVIAIGNGTNSTTDPKKILIMANQDQVSVLWATTNYQNITTNAAHGYYNLNNITDCSSGYVCDTIGSGQLNIIEINKTIGITNAPAAQVAANCTDGNYSDWYLPSMWELNTMNNYIGVSGRCNGTGQPTCMTGYHWSSTENKNSTAWDQTFNSSGGSQVDELKNGNLYVRAVRNEDY